MTSSQDLLYFFCGLELEALHRPAQVNWTVSWAQPTYEQCEFFPALTVIVFFGWWVLMETTYSRGQMWKILQLDFPLSFHCHNQPVLLQFHIDLYHIHEHFFPPTIFFWNSVNLLGTEGYISELNIPNLNLRYKEMTITSLATMPCYHVLT